MKRITYDTAGVHLEHGKKVKDSIKNIARDSHSENVLRGIGLFSGFYGLNLEQYENPVLVSSIDGVGTKVKIAQMMQRYESIGVDLVNHCVNDIMVGGADPLFFMDYIAADNLMTTDVEAIVRGITGACKEAGCALVGGETAEMPGIYSRNSFDLAGAIVGVVEKAYILDGSKIEPGDVLVGVASNGLHTNGYSLVRKVFFEENRYRNSDYFDDLQSTLGEELLRPHRSYAPLIKQVRMLPELHGMAHITGGGIEGNLSRLLRAGLGLRIDWSAWEPPAIFQLIKKVGNISDQEMRHVFNLGVGLVLIVHPDALDKILSICSDAGENVFAIGSVASK